MNTNSSNRRNVLRFGPCHNASARCLARLTSLLMVAGAVLVEPATASSPSGDPTSLTLKPVPFQQVKISQPFWTESLATNASVTIPFVLDHTQDVLNDLRKCGQLYRGNTSELPSQRLAGISDLFKAMEGAAYRLAVAKDAELERRMDDYIKTIAFGQREDGYLYGFVHEHLPASYNGPGGRTRYASEVTSHELYNVGHMYEGALAYWAATGKTNWLEVAEKNAQHVNRVFFQGDPNYNGGKPVMQPPGHEEIELALCRLYEATGKSLYLEMAKKFVDLRGTIPPKGPFPPEYSQQHKPVREQREAIGHAVRFVYLWSSVADLARLTGDGTYRPALDAIWADLVDRKFYITGGIGGGGPGEGFAAPYELPNRTAYSETCAAIGNVFFNYRMYLLTGEAKYLDIAEVSLLNTSLAGLSLDGKKFNYVNPLEADGRPNAKGVGGRLPWYGTACCNTNLERLVPQIPGCLYAHDQHSISLTLYGSSEVEIPLGAGKVKLAQQSNYPFDGKVAIQVSPEKSGKMALRLRIPTWAGSERFMPSTLYHYIDEQKPRWTLTLNGKPFDAKLEKGFAVIDREWTAGDQVVLDLPMPVRLNASIDQVAANRGKIAITRGPLVYAAEAIDNDGAPQRFGLDKTRPEAQARIIQTGVLKGLSEVSVAVHEGEKAGRVRMIPYFAWNNRGDFQPMQVWMAGSVELAKKEAAMLSLVTSKKYGTVTATRTGPQDFLGAITDGKEPSNSADLSQPLWSCRPAKNVEQSITFQFDQPRKVSQFQVYWVNDGKEFGVPASWKLERKVNGRWEDYGLYTTDEYGVEKDRFNTAMCNQVKQCEALRLVMKPQPDKVLGIHEVKIDE